MFSKQLGWRNQKNSATNDNVFCKEGFPVHTARAEMRSALSVDFWERQFAQWAEFQKKSNV